MKFVPEINFKTLNEKNKLVDQTYEELFIEKRVLVFSLPGAFTPTCTTKQLPMYDSRYDEIRELGIDDIYCVSVNDPFVMKAWGEKVGVKNITLIADGNGEFTSAMGMLVTKTNLALGLRSWRYSMIVDDCVIENILEEPGKNGNCPKDPYEVSDPETVISYLKQNV